MSSKRHKIIRAKGDVSRFSGLNKHDAAAEVGVSPRRLLELASQPGSGIRVVKERDPVTKRVQVYYNAADIEQFKKLRESRTQTAVVPYQGSHRAGGSAEVQTSRPPVRPIEVPLQPRVTPWITLAEAGAALGLPPSFLRSMILAGELPARNVGHHHGGGQWRVHWSDLEGFKGTTRHAAEVIET